MTQSTNAFTIEEMHTTIGEYETYFKGKRSSRQKYIMSCAIERFVNDNGLENPNQYLLYLISDKNLSAVPSGPEQWMITELTNELQKDIHLFQTI